MPSTPNRTAAADPAERKPYTRVFIEADSRGRMSVNIGDEDGGGHGHRLRGPKYDGSAAEHVWRADLDTRDREAIRQYLDLADQIDAEKEPRPIQAPVVAIRPAGAEPAPALNEGYSLPVMRRFLAIVFGTFPDDIADVDINRGRDALDFLRHLDTENAEDGEDGPDADPAATARLHALMEQESD